jgi:two-component system LytT family response regulator
MKVLIVDDEINARAALKGMITSNFPEITIVGEASDVPAAVKAIHQLKPDVVLLDIEMPGYLGIDLLDFFDSDQVNFKIIFITAYNDYAIKAFELAAVDYLLKPTRIEQLQRAFNRISSSNQQENEQYLVLKENLKTPSLTKIAIQTAEGLVISKLEEIRYLKADGAYTHIHFTNNQRITVTKTLQEYNILEETGSFFRVNRSYIINVHCIAKISKRDGGFVVMDNGEEISASLEKRNQLYNFFRDNIF